MGDVEQEKRLSWGHLTQKPSAQPSRRGFASIPSPGHRPVLCGAHREGAGLGYPAQPRSPPAFCSRPLGCGGALRRRSGLGKVSWERARGGRGRARRGRRARPPPGAAAGGEEEAERSRVQGEDARERAEASEPAPLLWLRSSRSRGGGRGTSPGRPCSLHTPDSVRPASWAPWSPAGAGQDPPTLPAPGGLGSCCGVALRGRPAVARILSGTELPIRRVWRRAEVELFGCWEVVVFCLGEQG